MQCVKSNVLPPARLPLPAPISVLVFEHDKWE